MAGCSRSLYKSIENLSDIYIQPDQDKKYLLNPKVANISSAKVPLLLPSVEHSYSAKKIYRCAVNHNNDCGYNCKYVANDQRVNCPSCRKPMTSEVRYLEYAPSDNINASSSSEGGYVKGLIIYMVMDDLEVKPMSTISSITYQI
jgi:hypothetical protein